VRHHTDFDVGELRIALDAVDERGATRRRGEQPLEHDEARTLFHDRLQRLNRLAVREREDASVNLNVPAECFNQVVRCDYQGGRRHSASLA
jgi:hypothetical protein